MDDDDIIINEKNMQSLRLLKFARQNARRQFLMIRIINLALFLVDDSLL